MKFGLRVPSFRKRLSARLSWKRYARHNLGIKAPKGWGFFLSPKRSLYNWIYNRVSFSLESLFKSRK